MKLTSNSARRKAAGFTLIELMVAVSIFSVLGYALTSALSISIGSQKTVDTASQVNRTLREMTGQLTNEFRLTRDDSIAVAILPDANHQVTFQLPILVAGAAAWGIPGSYLETAKAADAENWSLRYTVDVVVEDGEVNRRLVRQVLDAALTVQSQEVVADGLRAGDDIWPGFRVMQTGDVWDISLSMTGNTGGQVELHVATRN